ncbi:MAG: lipopolysaccharide heptosyltransferase II [bacterium]
MNIVVFCPNLIGDTVMATPFFRSLRAGFPGAAIHAVVKPVVRPVLDGLLCVDNTILLDHRSAMLEHQPKSVISEIKMLGAELAVLLPNSFRSAVMAWRSGVKRRVGYSRGGRGILLTDRLVPPNRTTAGFEPMPVVEYYMHLAQYLNCPDMGRQLEQKTTADDKRSADLACSRLNLGQADPLIVFNTGGAFGPAKNWPVEHFAELGRMLVRLVPGAKVAVICGPAEADNAREIVRLAGDTRVVSLADEPKSIGLSKAMIRRSGLVVTTDSGPRHFATAFGVPTVSLFGPTHIEWTRTFHPQGLHLQKQIDCGPCQKGICPEKHHRCMTEMQPADVLAACLKLLGRESLMELQLPAKPRLKILSA